MSVNGQFAVQMRDTTDPLCGGGVRGGGVLTRAGLDTGGAEAELPVLVGLGLEGDRVVDGRGRTVVLTHATVVEVTTRLRRDTTSRHRGCLCLSIRTFF